MTDLKKWVGSNVVKDDGKAPVRKGKTVETPIAWWEPATKKGSRLTVWRKETSIDGGPATVKYSYQGNGSSGGINVTNDAAAIAYVEREIASGLHGKMKRAK